jgi:hypothetical protein
VDIATLTSSAWSALSANGLTFAFTLALLGIFAVAAPFQVMRGSELAASFAHSAPATLVRVGILGTFVGLFASLHAFSDSPSTEGLPSLVAGLGSAVVTGLLGVLLALVFRIYRNLAPQFGSIDTVTRSVAGRAKPPPSIAEPKTTPISELQKPSSALENEGEETRCESQQSFEDLAAKSQALDSQVHETFVAEENPDPPPEKPQPARRFHLRIPVKYESEEQSGEGMLVDLSSSGALIEATNVPLNFGALVDIGYTLESEEKPTELYGKVVRETDSGFAVEFVERDSA